MGERGDKGEEGKGAGEGGGLKHLRRELARDHRELLRLGGELRLARQLVRLRRELLRLARHVRQARQVRLRRQLLRLRRQVRLRRQLVRGRQRLHRRRRQRLARLAWLHRLLHRQRLRGRWQILGQSLHRRLRRRRDRRWRQGRRHRLLRRCLQLPRRRLPGLRRRSGRVRGGQRGGMRRCHVLHRGVWEHPVRGHHGRLARHARWHHARRHHARDGARDRARGHHVRRHLVRGREPQVAVAHGVDRAARERVGDGLQGRGHNTLSSGGCERGSHHQEIATRWMRACHLKPCSCTPCMTASSSLAVHMSPRLLVGSVSSSSLSASSTSTRPETSSSALSSLSLSSSLEPFDFLCG